MYSIVMFFRNEFEEELDRIILDSSTRSGVVRKANTILKSTFTNYIYKIRNANYEYWHCYDVDDKAKQRLISKYSS